MKSLLLFIFLFFQGVWLSFSQASVNQEESARRNDHALSAEKMLLHIGESTVLTLFSDLRAPLAAFLWLEVESSWEEQQWEKMSRLLELIVKLQPHNITYYTMAAWELAWNASSAVSSQEESLFYIQVAQRILEQGISKNPRSSSLYECLGILLRDRLGDHQRAAIAFSRAAALPGAHQYLKQFLLDEINALSNHR